MNPSLDVTGCKRMRASAVMASPHVLHPGEQDGEGVGCGLAHALVCEGCEAGHFCHGFYGIAELDGIQETCGNGALKASLCLPGVILCLLRGLHEVWQLINCPLKLPLPAPDRKSRSAVGALALQPLAGGACR